MEPITITAAALLAGAQFIGTEACKAAVRDAYESLKQHVLGKASSAGNALATLESDPEDAGAVQSLDRQIARAGLDKDAELIDMAHAFIRLLEQEGLHPTQAFHATNIGDGAVAQGSGSTAAGKGAIIIRGSHTGDIRTGLSD